MLCCSTWWRGTTRRVCVCGVSPVSSSWTGWIEIVPTLMLAYNIMPTKRGFSEMLKATLFLLDKAWGIFQVDSMQIRLSADTCKGTSLPAQEVCSERAAMDIVKSTMERKGSRQSISCLSCWGQGEEAHGKASSWRDKANGGRKGTWLLKYS